MSVNITRSLYRRKLRLWHCILLCSVFLKRGRCNGPYEFGLDIPDEEAEKLRTVGDALKYLHEKLGS